MPRRFWGHPAECATMLISLVIHMDHVVQRYAIVFLLLLLVAAAAARNSVLS